MERSPTYLRIPSIIVDRISTLSACCLSEDRYIQTLREWYDFIRTHTREGDPRGAVSDTFWETLLGGCVVDDAGVLRESSCKDVAEWRDLLTPLLENTSPGSVSLRHRLTDVHLAAALGRRLCRTQSGRLGLMPKTAGLSDVVTILAGGKCTRRRVQFSIYGP